MKKQFEILEELDKITKESISSISDLKIKIEQETQKIKSKLLDLYDNDLEVLYLVDFYSDGMMHFHKATKDRLSTITLNWYDSKFRYKVPRNYEEGLKAVNEYPAPTYCDIQAYNTFGYFHDIKARYDRIDWIAQKTRDKQYLFQIEEADFIMAIDSVHNFYSNDKLKDLQHHKDSTIGLYAFDSDPKSLIKQFVNSQSDATRLEVTDVEELVEDWIKWVEDKNIVKSPFFQIE